MSNLIEKIWKGEYNPANDRIVYNEEIERKTRVLDEKERELWNLMGEKERLLFDNIMGVYYDMINYYKKDAFIQGVHFVGDLLKEMMADK